MRVNGGQPPLVEPEPTISGGNHVDTEATAEAHKVAASAPGPYDTGDDESAPDDGIVCHVTPSAINKTPAAKPTADELSEAALSAFKKACDEFLPTMTVIEDRRKARVYFMAACDKLDKRARMEAA